MKCTIISFIILSGALAILAVRPQYEILPNQEGDDAALTMPFIANGKLELVMYFGVNTNFSYVETLPNGTWLFNNSYMLHHYFDEDLFLEVYEWEVPNTAFLKDCFMYPDDVYGGTELYNQLWPVEQQEYNEYSWVTKEKNNSAMLEPFWLLSKGHYIYVDKKTPLFVSQSKENPKMTCLSAHISDPYKNRDTLTFKYYLYFALNADEGYIHAVNHFLQKPSGYPNPKMFAEPIWSTWVQYKRDINQSVVLNFAQDIKSHGYKGQIEIDDLWETCYGSLEFDQKKFSNVSELVQNLKNMGFRVTLWIHPFINNDCTDTYNEAMKNGYLVKNLQGSYATQWWNSGEGEAAHVDFTNEAAKNWWVNRLLKLKNETGLDGFKCDAGETSWLPQMPDINGPEEDYPNYASNAYVSTCALLGDLTEVRSGHGSQHLPIFFRMIDKDSKWGFDNGLKSLITTTLQFNMIGYPFVLPDMVGGNAYQDDVVTKELFIRWLQANTFLPSIQFSVLPWDFDEETENIAKTFVELHEQYAPVIMENVNRSVTLGYPLNAPIWWSDPFDNETFAINDQFLLGETILVAPVVEEGATSRNIYLPLGRWLDGNTKKTITGACWLKNYSAPLNVLPYFTRV